MQSRWTAVQEQAKARRAALEASLQVQQFYRDVDVERDYLQYRLRGLESTDYGKDAVAAQKLITKHHTLETELIEHEHEYDVVVATGENLLESDSLDADGIKKRLADLEELWNAVHAALEKRGQALEDSYEWQSFAADAAEEHKWLAAQLAAAQGAKPAETLEANTALLAKHDEFTSDLTEHSERVEDILALGERLVAAQNQHAAEVTAKSTELKESVAKLEEFAKAHRAQLEEAVRAQEFERDARKLDAVLAALEPRLAAPLATTKDAIARQLRELDNVEAEAGPNRSTAFAIDAAAKAVTAGGSANSAAIAERNRTLQERWAAFLKNLADRRAALLASQKQANEADELFLAFAEKATALSSWADSAQEDLAEEILVESVEEVTELQTAHAAFLESTKAKDAQLAELAALDKDIASRNLGPNPYTPITMQALQAAWQEVQSLAKVCRRTAGRHAHWPPAETASLTARAMGTRGSTWVGANAAGPVGAAGEGGRAAEADRRAQAAVRRQGQRAGQMDDRDAPKDDRGGAHPRGAPRRRARKARGGRQQDPRGMAFGCANFPVLRGRQLTGRRVCGRHGAAIVPGQGDRGPQREARGRRCH